MANLSEWSLHPTPDAEWTKASEVVFGKDGPTFDVAGDISSLRAMMKAAARKEDLPGVKKTDIEIPVQDGDMINARVYETQDSAEAGSLAVLIHGGGWCLGGLEDDDIVAQRMVQRFGFTCVSLDYRLAPEHKFPTAVYDCFHGTNWAAQNASRFNADPSRGFILVGASAGGNLATVVALMRRDADTQPPLTGLHLLFPALVHPDHVPEQYKADCSSWVQNKDAPVMKASVLRMVMDYYVAEEDRQNPLFSPLLWPSGDGRLAPCFLQICGVDLLRDEGLVFERVLRTSYDTPTRLNVYPGMPHGFSGMLPEMEASKQFEKDRMTGYDWLLSRRRAS